MLEKLLPEPIPRSDEHREHRPSAGGRTIVQRLHYSPKRLTEKFDLLQDVVPLFAVPMSLKLSRAPKRLYIASSEMDVTFEYLAGRVNLRVPEVRRHGMTVFE